MGRPAWPSPLLHRAFLGHRDNCEHILTMSLSLAKTLGSLIKPLNYALELLCSCSAKIGLQLNLAKCALIIPTPVTECLKISPQQDTSLLAQVPHCHDTIILGTPIGCDSFEATHFEQVCKTVDSLFQTP